MRHQYIVRETGEVTDEKFYHDRLVNYLYSAMREEGSVVYSWLHQSGFLL
jgi:hypothetical protein